MSDNNPNNEENSLTDLDIERIQESQPSDEAPNGILPDNGMGDDIGINPSEPPLVMEEPDFEFNPDDMIDGCWTDPFGGDEPKIMDKDEIASKPEVDEIINKPQSNDSGFYVGQDENPSVIDSGFNVNPEIEGLPEALSSILPGEHVDVVAVNSEEINNFIDDLIAGSKETYNPNEEHKNGEPTSTADLRNDNVTYTIEAFAKEHGLDDAVMNQMIAGVKSAMNDGDGLTREELVTILDSAGTIMIADDLNSLEPTDNIAEGSGIEKLIETMEKEVTEADIPNADIPENDLVNARVLSI